jgi:guanosine-3',5'-bis(diphosphate) 3'-pyrophosphohydrolase
MQDPQEQLMTHDFSILLKALQFSATKHRHQRRKDSAASPYINHPIKVANILWTIGGVHDEEAIVAAVLHDTIEDTDTTSEEILELFGAGVLSLVCEMTDDKNLPKEARKKNQIKTAPHLSSRAKQIKLADKICNIHDIAHAPPQNWTTQRKMEYLQWAEKVVDGLRGVNEELEKYFDETLVRARQKVLHEAGRDAPKQ